MKKLLWVSANCLLAAVAVTAVFQPRTAEARKEYKDEFDAMYVKAAGADPSFVKAAETAKCAICHEAGEGKTKKDRNAYGQALAKIVPKKCKDVAKIKESLEEVAKESSDPKTAGSPTFGELIKSGKLPGG